MSSSGSTLSPFSTQHYASIGILLVATTSRGNLTIASADNAVAPVLSMNWLQTDTDQRVAVEAVRRARQAWLGVPESVRIGPEASPGANVTTDAQILDFLRGAVGAIHHGSSTCKMGKEGDSMAVVDSVGRVFGTKGLRVIDSSSFVFTPPGHTQGVTCLLYTSPSPRDGLLSRMPSSA